MSARPSKKSLLTIASETEDKQADDSMKCFTVGDPDLEVDTTQVHVCEAG